MVNPTPHPPTSRTPPDVGELTTTERIHHVLNRFSFGAAPGQVDEIRQTGLEGWFEAQLGELDEESEALTGQLAKLGSLSLTNQQILRQYRGDGQTNSRLRSVPRQELKDAVLLRSVYGANRLLEVASDFFRNHLNVDVNKNSVRYFATEYEREVIRRHALGKFGDMVMSSARHPAMLVYLDNALSRRPKSDQELRQIERRVKRSTGSKSRALESVEIAKQRGLNENYARELLELHTLGVDNHYTQKDIIEMARALTGWTVQNDSSRPVTFQFRPDMHVHGDRRVLKGVIEKDQDNPVTEGERAIQRVLKHPGTADFLSFKLCRYFVSDRPSEKTVDRVSDVFRDTRGELGTVYRSIFADPEFFSRSSYLSKFKRPFEFVVSALRVTGARVTETRRLHDVLRSLSEPIYECEDPTGYHDQAEAWNDPGVMAGRWRFAMDLVRGKLRGVRIPATFYDGLHAPIPMAWKNQLAPRVLACRMSRRTSDAVDEIVRRHLDADKGAEVHRLAPLVLGMLLGSPEFQRQ